MSVATSTAIGLGVAGAGLIGGVASSAIGAGEAGNAASTQANSANYAANLQAQEAQNSLNFQQQVYGQGQANAAPWLQSGAGALSALDYGLGITPQGVGGPTANPAQFNGQFGGQPAGVTSSGQPAAPGIGGATPVSRTPLSGLANRPTAGTIGASANTGLQPTSNLAGVSPTGGPASPLANGGALNPSGQPTAGNPATTNSSGAPGFGSLLQGFQAPTAAEAAATPGYQFQLQQGEQAIDNGAAARGGLLSGNTLNAENAYGQGLAASNYQNTYNNAFNTFNSNQANQYNRLASLAGVGQTAASQLNSSGQAAASNIGNISQTAGQQIGQSAQNAGAATASGYVGAGNAINSGIGSATGSAQQGLLLSQLLNNNSNPAYNPYNTTGGG